MRIIQWSSVTTADMESSFISLIFDEINKYFQEIKLFNLNINKVSRKMAQFMNI